MKIANRSTILVAVIITVAVFAFSYRGMAANTDSQLSTAGTLPADTETAVFGGGCFWCMEHPFDELTGVVDTTSGYIGGSSDNPSYRQLSAGNSGHVEVVRVTFDPQAISYDALLDVYWKNVDPLTDNAQFCDSGGQYRSAIFTKNEVQRVAANRSKLALEESGRFQQSIVTRVENADDITFWPAEDYHQDYYLKNPIRYKLYRTACGRDARLIKLWSDAT
jgi:peptide-methionine (S)-S-oxide reductase